MRSLIPLLVLSFCTFVGCSKPPTNPANSSSTNPSQATPSSSDQSTSSASAQPAPVPVVVPAGTTLTIHLGQEVGSKVSQSGESFTGTLARAVTAEGNELIPAGSKVSGLVVDAKPLGHFKGGALLELRLTSVSVNGGDLPIVTRPLTFTKKGKGKRSAVMVGGGAGLGALVGGLLGGGKGAAIGAVAGAGGGAAGAAYTDNDEIVLPVEGALSFRLTKPVQLQ